VVVELVVVVVALVDMLLSGAVFDDEVVVVELSVVVLAAFCLQAVMLAAARTASEARARVRTGVIGFISPASDVVRRLTSLLQAELFLRIAPSQSLATANGHAGFESRRALGAFS
jgi:hypothetical protein